MKTITKIEPIIQRKGHKLKVAAYCRVSTSSDEQLESLSAQRKHYESYIQDHEDWEFAGIYYDEGISGTSRKKRTDLVRMLEDCKKGKIDFILTKSISRFSRNLVDCLSMVRELLGMGIGIYFEKENINTRAMNDEFLLTMLSGIAETESASISSNAKWAIRKRMEEGSFRQSVAPYGYRMKNGRMIADKKEAVVVQEIFAMALNGEGICKIASELNQRKISGPKEGRWNSSTIRNILQNERYIGDCLFQKEYTDTDYKRHLNHGEEDQYYVQNHHEALISRDAFERVQKLREQRCSERNIAAGSQRYHKRYTFSSRIRCENCGSVLKHQFIKGRGGIRYEAWRCKGHVADTNICDLKAIPQKSLENAFTTMMNKLIFSKKELFNPFFKSVKNREMMDADRRISVLDREIQRNLEKEQRISELVAMGILNENSCQKIQEDLRSELLLLKNEKYAMSKDDGKEYKILKEADKLMRILKSSEIAMDFKPEVFDEIVELIWVHSRSEISFQLKCGLVFREKVEIR